MMRTAGQCLIKAADMERVADSCPEEDSNKVI
jgi:hypothetical protein